MEEKGFYTDSASSINIWLIVGQERMELKEISKEESEGLHDRLNKMT